MVAKLVADTVQLFEEWMQPYLLENMWSPRQCINLFSAFDEFENRIKTIDNAISSFNHQSVFNYLLTCDGFRCCCWFCAKFMLSTNGDCVEETVMPFWWGFDSHSNNLFRWSGKRWQSFGMYCSQWAVRWPTPSSILDYRNPFHTFRRWIYIIFFRRIHSFQWSPSVYVMISFRCGNAQINRSTDSLRLIWRPSFHIYSWCAHRITASIG